MTIHASEAEVYTGVRHDGFGLKTIGFFGSMCLIVNSITGAGKLTRRLKPQVGSRGTRLVVL